MTNAGRFERRKAERQSVFADGTIGFDRGGHLRCVVQNVSEGGAKLVFVNTPTAPAKFNLSISFWDKEPEQWARTRWRSRRAMGVEFV